MPVGPSSRRGAAIGPADRRAPVRLVVGISGASGSIYGIRLLEVLRDVPELETHLIVSRAAKRTLVDETDLTVRDVEALATRGDGGDVQVLAWNMTLDQAKAAGEPLLDRTVTVRVDGLPAGAAYIVTREGVDAEHSNIAGTWASLKTTTRRGRPRSSGRPCARPTGSRRSPRRPR